MDNYWLVLALIVGVSASILFGQWMEAYRWRVRGDHEYMNRMESGGRLYQVKRER